MNYKSTTHRVNLVLNYKFWLITLLMVLLYSTVLLAQYSQTVYFDPSNSGDPDQDGSIEHPFDHVTDVTISPGTDYRFRRGTQMTLTSRVYLNYNDNIRLGAFGSGERPILYMNNETEDIIRIQSNNNVIIDSLHLINNNTLHSGVRCIEMGPGYGGNPNTKNITISNCEIEGGWVGINVQHGNGDYYTENLTIRNCEIHHIGMDGILFRDVTNGLIEGCHMHHLNQYWHTTTHTQAAGGDGIQTAHNCDSLKIYNNIIDRRNTGNKFCVLIGNLDDTTEPCYTEIVGNTFYPPKDTVGDYGGVAVLLQEAGGAPATVLFARNKIIGRKDNLGNSCQSAFRGDCDTLYFYYNIIDSCNYNAGVQRITSDCDYAEVCNNVFMGGAISTNHVFGVDATTAIVKNNLSGGNTSGEPLRLGGVDFLEESNNIEISSSNTSLYNDYLSIANWETSDYTRTSNLNDGVPLGLGYDIDSILVSNPPECGVCEYYDGTQTNTSPSIENQTFEIEENTTNGTQVGIVEATDPDPEQFLTYSILSGNTSNAFQIDGLSGELTVNNTNALDYETLSEFNLTVEVQDNGMGALTDQAVIAVNIIDLNEIPNILDQEFSLEENSPNGQEVGMVQAYDPDEGQTLAYTIISGNVNDAFILNGNSGRLMVNNVSAINHELYPQYFLTIQVQDNGAGQLSDQAVITINISDINEPPAMANQEFTIQVDINNLEADINNNQLNIGHVQASDPDIGQNLTFQILSGNDRNAFELNNNTGELIVDDPHALNLFDYYTYSLIVLVQDDSPEQLQASGTVRVYVNIDTLLAPDRESELLFNREIDNGQFSMNVYPNPVRNYFEIKLENLEPGLTSILIFNTAGEIISQNEFYSSESKFIKKYNVNNYGEGLYLIQIKNNSALYFSKIVKM